MHFDINLLLAVIGSVGTVVAIWQSQRAAKFAHRLATLEGAYKILNVQSVLFGETDIDEFGVAVPLRAARGFTIAMKFGVRNIGEKSARDLQVLLRIPRHLVFGSLNRGRFEDGVVPDGASVKLIATTGGTDTLLLQIPFLNPNQSFSIYIDMSLTEETFVSGSTEVPLRDGVADIEYSAPYEFAFEIVVMQADTSALTRRGLFHVIDTQKTSLAEFFNRLNRYVKVPIGGRPRRIKILSIPPESIISSDLPHYDTLAPSSVGTSIEGLRTDRGYVIPAANVYPDGGRLTS